MLPKFATNAQIEYNKVATVVAKENALLNSKAKKANKLKNNN